MHILIAEDVDSTRKGIQSFLESEGNTVSSADNGAQAWDKLKNTQFDLVISDVKMDGMDGLTLVQRLRKKFPKLPLALMTAHPSDGVYKMVQEKLVDFLLLKPFQIDELQGMVLNLTS